jgi:hypothetical protein
MNTKEQLSGRKALVGLKTMSAINHDHARVWGSDGTAFVPEGRVLRLASHE